jgi:putative proteasome-type protease
MLGHPRARNDLGRSGVTYCVGIKIKEGLIALSDGRVTSGNQVSHARKLTLHGAEDGRFMVMTSGLRSVRDKTLAYLERDMRAPGAKPFRRVLDAVDGFCGALRQVKLEDQEALEAAALPLNLHCIMGGQLIDDAEPGLYMIYPEGNWIACDERTPYLSVGSTSYGKPILDRALSYDTPMQVALKIAYLSFDSTRFSAADVGYPIDLATLTTADRKIRLAELDYDDLMEQRQWWNSHITQLAGQLPDGPWVGKLLP